MDDGPLHFRTWPSSQVSVRAAERFSPDMPDPYVQRRVGGRYLWMHLVPVGRPTRITPRDGGQPYQEWFAHASVRLPWPRPPFLVGHTRDGGSVVGRMVRLFDAGAWIDGIAHVDDSDAGDALLEDIGPDGGNLPVSIGFQPISAVSYPEGIRRTAVELSEVAVVEQSAYGDDARTYARGLLPPPSRTGRDWAA
jgi:hypothetical protein